MTDIDWSPYEDFPEGTCTCVCRHEFRSHAKFSAARGLISRKPCPKCDKDLLRKFSSDPETFIIRR